MTTESVLASLLRDHVHPLTHVEPNSPLDDLTPLASIIGDATIVMLGEATHGTREFFQLKHRIVRYLVTNLGFTLFGIEASWPECTAINDYVVNGVGEAAQALARQGFWTWDTEEVLSLLEWMRSYNSMTPHDRRVQFFGFDAVHAPLACAMVAAYFERVDPTYAREIGSRLHELGAIQPFQPPEDEQHGQLASALISDMQSRLGEHHGKYIAVTSNHEWSEALQSAVVLGQIDEKRRESDGAKQFSLRDIAMARNVEWRIAQQERARAILWAHNGHVTRDTRGMFDESIATMGQRLSRSFGDDLVSVGFAFGEGSFQAIVDAESDCPRLDSVTVGPPPAESLDISLAHASEGPAMLLDMREGDPRLRNWLAREHVTRETGAVFTTESDMLRTLVPSACFDALVFVGRTTRSRPTPTRHRPKP